MRVLYPEVNEKKVSNLLTLKGKDIVVVGLQPWYYHVGSNCKDIASRLAEHNRVLYVNKPLNRKTWVSKTKDEGVQLHYDLVKESGNKVEKIKKNMWQFFPASVIESINWLPSTSVFKKINYVNNKRFAKDIESAIKELGFKDIILFNDNDIFNGYYLKELLSPSLYVYYCRDYLRGYDYWKKHCDTLEPELIEKADVVVTNSEYYANYCSSYNASSYYIGQGCNTRLFNADTAYEMPVDLKNIPYPIIGYTGVLDIERLDEEIIAAIALQYSNANIVLVGPEEENFLKSKLHNYSNIHFLGRKKLQELPAYVNAFDVCINPQVKNEITKGNYPLKIDEYLSMGKAVVATRTEAMRMFEPFTYLSDSPAEFADLIEKALTEDNDKLRTERIVFAGSHTWEKSVEKLSAIINKYLS
ncbi:glycosyltransferase [Parafilimonas terrae]|uniref:Glycosyltransferase involved in cell wall bisynthesis n=1 Tax=Parafilimonas terrae TaxID=1465490 RepID=A0A1I5UHH7_9BACT|nr:glycosyltransferase [Parafilimonas terrae]SFP94680.1 Glycosyltransferase involved in cell wall bisynthesis [Parafilimonas terrae]